MKLYEISEHIEKVLAMGFSVDEETGEILFDEADLEQLDMELNEKLENIMLVIKNLAADEDALKNEKANIAARQKSKARKREWLEGYMISNMKRLGIQTFETEKGVAKLGSRKSTIIDDEALIPKQYMKEKVDYTPDKTAIKTAIESGEVVPGARYDVPEGKITVK